MSRSAWVAATAVLVLSACSETNYNYSDYGDAKLAAGADVADSAGDAAAEAGDSGSDAAADLTADADTSVDSAGTDAAGEVAAADVAPEVAADADAADSLDCSATLTALQSEIDKLQSSHSDCSHDEECTTVPSGTACQGTCGVAILKSFASTFASALSDLNDKYCVKTGFSSTCGFSTPKCIAPNPGCVAGKCVYKK